MLLRGGQLDLDRSGTLLRFSHGLLFTAEAQQIAQETPLKIGENQLFPDRYLSAELVSRENPEKFSSVHRMFTDFVLDYDIIKGYVMLHGRKPALHMRPAERKHSVSVKKWLNAEVSPAKRQYIHYLSDSEGLIWAEGLGAAERVRVTNATQRMLVLHVHKSDTGCT